MIASIYSKSDTRLRVAQLAAFAIFICTTLVSAEAAAPPVKDTYVTLTLPGVIGNFTTIPNAPANAIEVYSISAGASCPSFGTTTCTTPNIAAISLAKAVDDASPKLFLALATGVTYTNAVINFWLAPTSGTNYTKTYTIYLTKANLQSVQISGSEGGSPLESLSLGFATIAFQDNLNGAVGCYNVSTKASSGTAITC